VATSDRKSNAQPAAPLHHPHDDRLYYHYEVIIIIIIIYLPKN